MMEARIEAETGRILPPPQTLEGEVEQTTGSLWEIFRPPYRKRTIMLIIFQLVQTIGYYGFASWVPTLLASQGVDFTKSLAYTSIIAVASPVAALIATQIADRFERKWQLAGSALATAGLGLLFSQQRTAAGLIPFGLLIAFSNTILAYSLHAYQSGALSDPHPRQSRRLHLFLEPVQHDLCRLFRRLLSAALRHSRRLCLHRRGDGHRVRGHRDHGAADDPPAARGDLKLRRNFSDRG